MVREAEGAEIQRQKQSGSEKEERMQAAKLRPLHHLQAWNSPPPLSSHRFLSSPALPPPHQTVSSRQRQSQRVTEEADFLTLCCLELPRPC